MGKIKKIRKRRLVDFIIHKGKIFTRHSNVENLSLDLLTEKLRENGSDFIICEVIPKKLRYNNNTSVKSEHVFVHIK
jgi:transposase